MTQPWIKPVEHDDIVDGATYFIAIRPRTEMMGYNFQARDIKRRACWSSKPGIADRFVGSAELRGKLADRPSLVAVEVPDDADSRWKRRKTVFRASKLLPALA